MTKPSIAKLKAIIGEERDIGDIPEILSLEKINSEEPYWNVTIRGSNVTMSITDPRDIVDYRRFVTQCFKQLNMVFPLVKQAIWLNTLREVMPRMTEKQADEDTTREGHFKELLETFLTNRMRGKVREDLLRGVPWEDEESRRRYAGVFGKIPMCVCVVVYPMPTKHFGPDLNLSCPARRPSKARGARLACYRAKGHPWQFVAPATPARAYGPGHKPRATALLAAATNRDLGRGYGGLTLAAGSQADQKYW